MTMEDSQKGTGPKDLAIQAYRQGIPSGDIDQEEDDQEGDERFIE